MPLVVYALLGIGAIVATIASGQAVMYALARPRVTFIDKSPAAYWSKSDEQNGKRWDYIVIHLGLRNDGNEETHVIGFELMIRPMGGPDYTPQLVSTPKDHGLIPRNGGQWRQRLAFVLEDPPDEKRWPHSREPHAVFYGSFPLSGKLAVSPSQHKRLRFWGSKTVSNEINSEPVAWKEMQEWLREEDISLADSNSAKPKQREDSNQGSEGKREREPL